MSDATRLIRLFGSTEDTGEIKTLRTGPLSLDIDGGKLRNIAWHGVELIRAFDYPIRDRNWGTIAVTTDNENIEQNANEWSYKRAFTSVDGQLAGQLIANGDHTGKLTVEVSFTASSDYETARTGFTVLHPIKGLAGGNVAVTHGDGRSEPSIFPKEITPSQPVYDMAGLTYSIDGATAEIIFEGEIFEMEDQRNWTDASYKTYCRPLGWPRPYLIKKGETLSQKISVSFSGDASDGSIGSAFAAEMFGAADEQERMPDVLLVLEAAFLPNSDALLTTQKLEVPRVSARVTNEDECNTVLKGIKSLGVPFDFEVIVPNNTGAAAEQLAQIAKVCSDLGLQPEHVIAAPEDYMKSYQPDGEWPEGLTPQASVALCKKAFPDAMIGGGGLTNFTEFNRCRPNPRDCDFITHSTTAIVHAADDTSVFETLEAQPNVYASAQGIAPDVAYRLGLVSIAFRSNPYGPAPLANPEQIRLEMAQADPRQRGLFAASWMVGAMSATHGFNIESLSLATPVGPLGVVYRSETWPQPLFDDEPDRIVYPAYHVLKTLAQMSGQPRAAVTLADGLFGVAAQTDTGLKVVVSNGSPVSQILNLPAPCPVLVLNEDTFDEATRDADWLKSGRRTHKDTVDLGPYAVAFIEFAQD